MIENFAWLDTLVIWIIPVLTAIIFHEIAHGYVANLLGDASAKMMGRLSLNPIKHIDPIGTILVPSVLFFIGGFIFGWAKPVPVNFSALNQPKRDMALVAVAGPLANLLMAVFWLIIYNFGFYQLGSAGISINIILMVVNLLPLLPLDGGRILESFLPNKLAYQFAQTEKYGFFILLFLLSTGLLNQIIMPLVRFMFLLFGF
ncbi:FIG004556: membrane metalloprotease [hydrothermal vent metagenome]|uniref:FIG004556: membrane metalloprotease n=1 Tax=hydrothermal vent metagenome TaxID=652676 RepID=A0A1W1CTR1_9ZZZZ